MPDNSGPVGLLPLFDGHVIDQQIQSVVNAGANKIILVSPTMNNMVLQYVDRLQGRGIDIEIVRSGHDLVQFVAPENELIYLNDGILPDRSTIEKLSSSHDEIIFVTPDSQQVTGFERIDRNDRWLGIAKLKASRLSEFIDLPEDWDVGSALLRGAVQSGCIREVATESDLSDGAVSVLTDDTDISKFSKKCLQYVGGKRRNILEKTLIWPFTKALLPKLWKAPSTRNYLGWAAPAAGILAGCVIALKLPVIAALALLILGMLMAYVYGKIGVFSNFNKGMDRAFVATFIISIIVIAGITIQQSIPVSMPANLVILVLAIGSTWLIHRNTVETKWDLIKPDTGLSLVILLGFSIFGSFILGIYVIALLGMAYLLVSQFDLKDE
ncbi:MAG: hypothetical protein ABJN65_15425 [Parasphingorhabdus sp.]